MNNYSEQIFQSIDTIISQRLNEVKFDRTITCEVITGVKDYPNKYWVSDGATKFQACVADSSRTYTEKQKVYVLIPNGDYNSTDKVIIGSYTADELPKNLYTNPFDHLVYSSKILFTTDNKYIETSTDTESLVPMILQGIDFNYSNTTPFDYIGLDFSFNTTDLYGMKKGNYGIQFTLKNNDVEIFTSAIDSSQLYGDIYNFNSLMKMQHLFPIPTGADITQANELVINLYQKGNFDIAKKRIYLKEASFYFGYDVEKIDSNKLILHLDKSQSLTFKETETEEELKRKLYLEWQNTDLKKIYSYNNQEYPSNEKYKYTVYWCKYMPGYKKDKNKGDIEETGVYWQTIEAGNSFTQEIKLVPQSNTQQFKVGVKYRDQEEFEKLIAQQEKEKEAVKQNTSLTEEEKQKKIKEIEEKYKKLIDALWKYIESNALIFTNEDVKAEPGSTNNSEDSIKLTCSDSGVYNYYMAQGPIVDYSYTREERTITASFLDGYDIEKDSRDVTWEIVGIKEDQSNNNETMIKINAEKSTNKTLVFTIKDGYLSGRNDLNTILCTATLPNGEIRRGKITLYFGEISTAGSQYAFNLHFEDNKSCLHPINGNNLTVSATLQRRDGETISPLPDIEWSIEGNNKDKNNTVILSTVTASDNNYSCTLTYMLSSGFPEMADNEYYSATLKAVIKDFTIDNGLTTDLTAYLPIPLGANNCDYISGITSVSYFTNGPSKMVSKKKYQIYGIDIPAKVQWLPDSFKVKIEENNEEKEVEKPFLPYVDSKKTTLVVPTFPAWENNQETLYYGVVAKNNDIILWMQPIVLKQNGYDDDFVNSYSNALTIDEGRNAIGVATLVVGRKEENNKLTGIEMGELYQVDNDGKKITYLESGLYGKQKNVNMFYLTNKGAFFVGDKNTNYISFNDEVLETKNALRIKTSNFYLSANNLLIDNNTGISLGNKLKLNIDGSASIAGWIIDSNSIYNIAKVDAENQYEFRLWNPGVASGTIISCQKLNTDTYPFYVNRDGFLKALNAEITGKITATSGKIAEYTISGAQLKGINVGMSGKSGDGWAFWAGSDSSEEAPFRVGHNGNLIASQGTVGGWALGTNNLTCSAGDTSVGIYSYSYYWHNNDPQTGRAADVMVVKTGTNYPFVVRKDGSLYCSNATIKGTLQAGTVIQTNSTSDSVQTQIGSLQVYNYGELGTAMRHYITDSGVASGGSLYISAQDGCGLSNTYGGSTEVQVWPNSRGYLVGTWAYKSGSSGSLSDKKLKNSINNFTEDYDLLFNNLTPRLYKYNNGTSNRIHFGFIAQETEEAIKQSNLTQKDVAFIINMDELNGESYKYLRYEEFIALNTWQIQKLKQRVTELENEIKEIKQNENN